MSYPKPLSQKSIDRLYRESGISPDIISFIRTFCTAAANLYGVICAIDLWHVYKELSEKTDVPVFRRREMYQVMHILRREEVPFAVLEVDEVYRAETREDKFMILASEELILSGYYRYDLIYEVDSASQEKPFYVPEDLLKFAEPQEDIRETKLIQWLSGLQCTEKEFEDRLTKKTLPCQYTGKRLGEFSFISRFDDFDLRYEKGELEGHKGNAKRAAELEARLYSQTAAERLVKNYIVRSKIGSNYARSPLSDIEQITDDLNEMGVALKEKQLRKLLNDLMDLHNHLHLWCNRGWTPEALARYSRPAAGAFPTISFGPGIQQAFQDGSIDKSEVIRRLKEMGFQVDPTSSH